MTHPAARRWLIFALPLGLAVAAVVAFRSGAHRAETPSNAALEPPPQAPPTAPMAEPSAPAPVAEVAPPREEGAPTAASPARTDAKLVAPGIPESEEVRTMRAIQGALRGNDPQRALALIEAADREFGPENEQRRRLEIEALVGTDQIGRSHAKAEQFYRTYPDSSAARDVERLTGYHPRPWGPDGG